MSNNKKKGRVTLNTLIYWGASVVVTGLTFKLLHWEGGEWLIAVSMSVEACLFFISGIQSLTDANEPAHGIDAVTVQQPHRQVQNNDLDELLAKSLNHQTIDKLNKGFEQFNRTVETVNEIAKIGTAGMTKAMVLEVEGATAQMKVLHTNLLELNGMGTAKMAIGMSKEFESTTNELKQLRSNLSELNAVYKAQLDAFRKA
jgi:gliding motility-associated protein GldL